MYEYLTRIATDIFDSREKAERWMHTYNRVLQDTPINMIDQPELVERVLRRIEYGVFS